MGTSQTWHLKKKRYCSVFCSFFTECSFSRGRLQGTTVSTHSSRDTGGAECSQGSKGKFIFLFTSECHVKWMQTGPEVFTLFVSNPNVLSFKTWLPLQLAQDGLVNQSDARLLHELGERARTLLHSYFRSPSGLFVAFTHLVCRSAIAGNGSSPDF